MIVRRKQHDTVPLETTLKANGKAVPIGAGGTVVFNMAPKPRSEGITIVRKPVVVTDQALGKVKVVWDGPLDTPVNLQAAVLLTGGALPAGDYSYRVTALGAIGETVGSASDTITATGATSSVDLDWDLVAGAVGYRVYRAAGVGPFLLLTTTVGALFTDTGLAAGPQGIPLRDESSETAHAGVYRCEWEVTFSDGTVETFPDGDSGDPYFDMEIVADLG